MNEIQKADPKARKKAIWIVLVASILGTLILLPFSFSSSNTMFQTWMESKLLYAVRYPLLAAGISGVLITPILCAALYLFQYSRKCVASEKIPPPGYSVIKDTPVLRGSSAITRGRLVQILSMILCFASISIPLMIWYIFHSLQGCI